MKNRWEKGETRDFDKGAHDFVGVLVQKEGEGVLKPFLLRRAALRFDCQSVTVFGRTERNATDKHVEVRKVVFRDRSDLGKVGAISNHPCIEVDCKRFTQVSRSGD